jgi:hypothetical protein
MILLLKAEISFFVLEKGEEAYACKFADKFKKIWFFCIFSKKLLR